MPINKLYFPFKITLTQCLNDITCNLDNCILGRLVFFKYQIYFLLEATSICQTRDFSADRYFLPHNTLILDLLTFTKTTYTFTALSYLNCLLVLFSRWTLGALDAYFRWDKSSGTDRKCIPLARRPGYRANTSHGPR